MRSAQQPRNSQRMRSALLACCALMLAGCSSLRLPQLDPSGRNLFLPPPNYTTITPPGRELLDAFESASPKAAWVEPSTPPPVTLGRPVPDSEVQLCGFPHEPPGAGPIKGFCRKPLDGHVTLSPERIVAPVGSEVVLVSGLCDAQGNLVTAEPIEWTLSQESVGNFVQVGERGHCALARLVSNNPRKISNDFALGRASTEARFITRGTPTPVDDLPLKKGESWVSLTSAKEGESHVTVLAPQAQNWDMRKRIASVYWVDAQWLFPQPAVARASETHILETLLSRGRDFSPISDFIVKYEVVGGPPATFPAAGNDSIVEVLTDADGRAAVEIRPTSDESGTTLIHMQVIQPATKDGSRPALVLGEGDTSVTWSVPRIEIQVDGPPTAGARSDGGYRIAIQNTGDIPLTNVIVTGEITGDASLIQSLPEAARVGNKFEWRLGDMPARSATPIDLSLRMGTESIKLCARVDSDERLAAEDCFDTTVEAQALLVTMRGPESGTAAVGEFVEFIVDVSNQSSRQVNGVTITDRFDAGLEHETAQPSPIIRDLGVLRPGESKPISIRFLVKQLGELCHTFEAVANTGERGSAQGCVRGVPREEFEAGPLRVKKTGPLQARVGEKIRYAIDVENAGDRPLTDLIISDVYDIALEVLNLTEDHRWDRVARTIEWRVDTLEPGQSLRFEAEYECRAPSVNAGNRVTVTTGQGHSVTGEARTQIAPAASLRPAGFSRSGTSRRESQGWTTSVRALASVSKGDATHQVNLQNQQKQAVRDIYVEISVPASVTIADAKTKLAPVRRKGSDGRVIIIGPIAAVRAGEELQGIDLVLQGDPPTDKIHVSVQEGAK